MKATRKRAGSEPVPSTDGKATISLTISARFDPNDAAARETACLEIVKAIKATKPSREELARLTAQLELGAAQLARDAQLAPSLPFYSRVPPSKQRKAKR